MVGNGFLAPRVQHSIVKGHVLSFAARACGIGCFVVLVGLYLLYAYMNREYRRLFIYRDPFPTSSQTSPDHPDK